MSPICGIASRRRPRPQRRPPDLQFAEPRREIVQLPVGQVLIVEHQHGIVGRSPATSLASASSSSGSAGVDAADLGADMRVKRGDADGPCAASGGWQDHGQRSFGNSAVLSIAPHALDQQHSAYAEPQESSAWHWQLAAPFGRRPSTGCRCASSSIRIFDIFMPKTEHPHVKVEHVARMPGRATETFACEWGLSLHLESEAAGRRNQYLLDFGFTPEVLNRNFDLLGIAPEQLDGLILSHSHRDHYGGLVGFVGRYRPQLREAI